MDMNAKVAADGVINILDQLSAAAFNSTYREMADDPLTQQLVIAAQRG